MKTVIGKSRSIGIKLNDIINNNQLAIEIFNNIELCSDVLSFNGHEFNVIFYHEGLSSNEIKLFVKKHTDKLFHINSVFTKNKNARVFFLNSYDDDICNYRYRYKGNIFGGFEQYRKLMKLIKIREMERKFQ